MSNPQKNVGRVSPGGCKNPCGATRQTILAHGDVGVREEEAANPTYRGMAGEWRESTWGEEISLEYGKSLRGYDGASGKFRVFGSNGPIGWTSLPLANGPGVILGRKGAYRGVQYSRDPFFVIDTAYYVVPKTQLDMRWVYYAIKHHKLGEIDDGSPIPSTTRSAVYVKDLLVPPPTEQKAIAHILGTLDDKIELNRRMNTTLEAMARALFQSWFVDFDPVRAKLDGRKPASLDAATVALFPAHFQDSPLGHIPQGWEVCPLADKIELLSGGTPKTGEPDYWDGDIPWFSVKDAPTETDVWVIHTEKSATKLGIRNSAAQIFPEKTTIISARGTVGKLALTGTPMAMNQSCYGVRGITGYGDYFTYYSLRSATAQLQQRTHGTVFDTITRQTFETLDCIFPPPELTTAFDLTVEPLLEQIRANLHQSRTLATLRNALLPKLLSGELSVDVDAEKVGVVA